MHIYTLVCLFFETYFLHIQNNLYKADQRVTPLNTCNNQVWYTSTNSEVQCLIENFPTDLHLGYTDENLRSEWKIDANGILTLKAFRKNAKNTPSIETQDLAQALADWYNNLACKVEFAVQRRNDQCPPIPTFRTPVILDYKGRDEVGAERLTWLNENECVARFRYRNIQIRPLTDLAAYFDN